MVQTSCFISYYVDASASVRDWASFKLSGSEFQTLAPEMVNRFPWYSVLHFGS